MQKKIGFLACATVMSANLAFAQSSHDEVSIPDADLNNNSSKFAISSPDGKFKLGFGGHLQHDNRFSYINSTSNKDFDTYIKQARIKLYGNAFDPALSYFVQVQLEHEGKEGSNIPAPNTSYQAPGTSVLRDYYVNWAFNKEYFHLRVGKFRTPFSRQQLLATSQMQFNDQNIASDRFQLTESGHDVGLMLHNGFHNELEWALAAVSNGLVLRLGYNYGIDAYDLVDFTGGGLRFAVAANGFIHTNYKSSEFNKDMRVAADFIVKYEGLSANGEFYFRRAGEKNELGGGLDAGYLIDRKIEPVVRYSMVKSGDPINSEIRGGINYYVFGHHLKAQAYVGPELLDSKIQQWEGGLQLQFAL